MKSTARWFIIAAMGAAAVLAVDLKHGQAQLIAPDDFRYQTGCEAVDATTVEGFVTNPGTGILRINGMVRFTFTVASSMSRPTIQVPVAAVIPPVRPVSVARVRLASSLLPNEVCQLDVSGAAR